MFGNTSCSTIPLTLVHGLGEELRRAQHKVILCGFGVGLSWGTVACEAGPLVCSPLIEV